MVPVVRALQRHWPDCRISWVIGKLEYQLLRHLDGVDFITFDKNGGWSAVRKFRKAMRQHSFDVLLHMQAALRASLLASSIRAPIKLGFDRERAIDGQWLFSSHRIQGKPQQHVLEGFLGFLEALGVAQQALDWRFELPAELLDQARQRLPQAPYAVLNPCSSVRRNNWRNWPMHCYAPVIEFLAEQGLQCVVTGGPSEEEKALARELASASATDVLDLVGQTSLDELAAIIQGARLVIAPDTGPLHIANLLNVPAVGLYASSNPLRTGPYRSPEYSVNKYHEAAVTYLEKPAEQLKWGQRVRHREVMKLIQPADVLDKVKLALQE